MPYTVLEDLTIHQLCAFAARRKALVRLAHIASAGGRKRDDRLAGQVCIWSEADKSRIYRLPSLRFTEAPVSKPLGKRWRSFS